MTTQGPNQQCSNLVDDRLGTGVKDVDSIVVEIQVIYESRKDDLVKVCKHKRCVDYCIYQRKMVKPSFYSD
jgi:hypothetical protein